MFSDTKKDLDWVKELFNSRKKLSDALLGKFQVRRLVFILLLLKNYIYL